MSQSQLAIAAGMSQNNLSRIENPEYGKQTISSLKRIADALDVALVVRFVPFSQYIDWLSGVPRTDFGISAASLAVPSFEREEKQSAFEASQSFAQVMTTTVSVSRTATVVALSTSPYSSQPLDYGKVINEPNEQYQLTKPSEQPIQFFPENNLRESYARPN